MGDSLAQSNTPELPPVDGVYRWDASRWHILEGPPEPTMEGGLLRVRGRQEISIRAENIEPGDYYLRVRVESGAGNGLEELNRDDPFLYLNGAPVDFARASPTTPLSNTQVAIIESRSPLHIEAGDEFRWNSEKRAGKLVGEVALSREPLKLAPNAIRRIYDPALHDVFRVSGTFTISPSKNFFRCTLRNVSGRPAEFQLEVKVLDYWQRVAAEKKEKISLNDREMSPREIPFALGDSDRYRASVTVTGPEPFIRENVYEVLVDNPTGARPRLWLNKDWEWTSIADKGSPDTRTLGTLDRVSVLTDWKKVTLPASWEDARPKDHLAWYRRKFNLPEWLAGKRMFLHFSRVSYECEVYLNGKKAGSHFGPIGPFELEVTDTVQPGANDLLIQVRGNIAALAPEEWTAPQIDISKKSRFRAVTVKGGVGEVWLSGTGEWPIGDIAVIPSFRKKSLKLQLSRPELPAGRKAVVSNTVLFQGKEVLHFPDLQLDGKSAPLEVTAPWPEPILWNPGSPALLQLRTLLKREDGTVVDAVDTRFGFREFWVEGNKLIWNGQPMKFAAVPFLSTWGWSLTERSKRDFIRNYILQSKRLGVTMFRHIYDPEYRAEIQDEEGIVIAQAGAVPSQATKQKLESDEFWRNTTAFNAEMIRGLKNHPSIFSWYVSNEFMAADEHPNQERLRKMGEELQPLDPTRFVEFGCDLDLGGYSPVISTHYPVDVGALRDERGLLPEAAYWHPLDRTLHPGDAAPDGIYRRVANVHGDTPIKWGIKPLIINETLWNFFFNTPHGLSRLAGEDVYASPIAAEEAYKEANSWFIRGHRDAEASVVTPWEWVHRDPVRISLPAVDINPLQRYANFFAGETIEFDVNLHHDRPRNAELAFVQTLKSGDRIISNQVAKLLFSSGELKRGRVRITLPAGKERSRYQLVLQLLDAGKLLREMTLPVLSYPKVKVSFPPKAGLFDPAGTAAEIFKDFAGSPVSVQQLTDDSLRGIELLIVGENAATSSDEKATEVLTRFAEGGGRILALAQDKDPLLLPFHLNVTKLVSSKMWSFYPNHPVLRDLEPEALSFWYPEHRTGGNFYLKPDSGGARTLLESGGPNGLTYAGLIERPMGKGLLVCAQLDLTRNLTKNPVATLLWRNLFDYLARPCPAAGRAGFAGSESGSLGRKLKQMGATLEQVSSSAELAKCDIVIMDGSVPCSSIEQEGLRNFVREGGTLFLHGITPGTRELAEFVADCPIQLAPLNCKAWHGRAVRVGNSDLLAGLTSYDLFWKRKPDSEDYAATFFNENASVAPLGQWTVSALHGQTLLYPSWMVELKSGKGRLILDNLQWDKSVPALSSITQRLGSILLSNLGVRLAGKKTLKLPPVLSYDPVDLRSVMNRSLVDEVADDGKGGWTDQGPEADLRSFPSGSPQSFLGVPFQIDREKGALVLASSNRPAGAPEVVELPVRGRADVLFFLLGSAWTAAKHQASLVVNYSDDSQYEIQLVGGVNLRDWAGASPDPFPFETDTLTRLAWSGSSKKFSKIGLYLTAWPNPHPEKEIVRVTFRSTRDGVTALMGVTLGSVPEQKQSTIARDEKKALELLEKGRELQKEGKLEPAESALSAAVKADPLSESAYLELAVFYEAQQKWSRAVETYEALLNVAPNQLEAYFRLGKAHEEMKDWSGAESVYRRALEANANQPEVLRALAELEGRRK